MDRNITDRAYVHALDDMLETVIDLLDKQMTKLHNALMALGMDMRDNPGDETVMLAHDRAFELITELTRITNSVWDDRAGVV